MKICFASLRRKINYTDVLEYGMDVFYESFRYYKDNNPQHEYSYYNFAWGSKGAKRDKQVIKEADVIVLPMPGEFVYFTNGVGPRTIEESQRWIRDMYDDLNDKHIILITQDRAVDENLILDYTFDGHVKPKSFQTIDEMDFTMCLQGLKYHYIHNTFRFPVDKDTDFVYWGSDKGTGLDGKKSGDKRTNIIKSISREPEITSAIIGRWPKDIKIARKWMALKDTLGYLDRSLTTLCFNWIDQTAVTGRYHEALACNVVPLVWQDYDTNNILVTDDWQRCFTKEEFYVKIEEVKKDHGNRLRRIKKDFLDRLPTELEYYKEFEVIMNKRLK
jgi:hypothetical protein